MTRTSIYGRRRKWPSGWRRWSTANGDGNRGFLVLCLCACLLTATRAHAQNVDTTSPQVEALLAEYQIRLEAHRRELLEREAALEHAKREIATLRKARSDR